MLTSWTGAGVPHSLPSLIGACGITTTSRPLRRSAQCARAASISWADHGIGGSGGGLPGLLCGRVRGQGVCDFGASEGSLPSSAAGVDCCADATGTMAKITDRVAAATRQLARIQEYPRNLLA